MMTGSAAGGGSTDMKRRGIVLGLLIIRGLAATAAFRNCGRHTPTDGGPSDQPSLSSSDPAEASQAYWLAARQTRARCGRVAISRDEFRRQAEAVKSPADGRRAWAELAEGYSRAAAANADGVRELRALPRDRVDPA